MAKITTTTGSDADLTLEPDGTGDINLTPGTNGDVNIPANKGITFGNAGEKIEGNGTKLDIAAAEIDFSIEADGDINIGTDIGLTFGDDGEKIEGDGTDLTIASSAVLNVNTGSSAGNDLKVNTSQLVVEGDTGNVGIGATAPATTLDVRNTTSGNQLTLGYTGSAVAKYTIGRETSGGFLDFNGYQAGLIGYQFLSGNVGMPTVNATHKLQVTGSAGLSTGTAWTNTSDERIKTNIETIENALAKINQLRPVSYNYSKEYLDQHAELSDSKTYNSFIAQEYEQVFPDAVSVGENLERVITEAVEAKEAVLDKDGNEISPAIEAVEEVREILVEDMLQFTPHDLNMYLVGAVQELSAKVTTLENA